MMSQPTMNVVAKNLTTLRNTDNTTGQPVRIKERLHAYQRCDGIKKVDTRCCELSEPHVNKGIRLIYHREESSRSIAIPNSRTSESTSSSSSSSDISCLVMDPLNEDSMYASITQCDLYDRATWRMYNRIMDYRERNQIRVPYHCPSPQTEHSDFENQVVLQDSHVLRSQTTLSSAFRDFGLNYKDSYEPPTHLFMKDVPHASKCTYGSTEYYGEIFELEL